MAVTVETAAPEPGAIVLVGVGLVAVLRAADLPDDVEPLFDAPRIVPAVDQIAFKFEVSE